MTDPRICTGVSATWCPVHGDCVCPVDEDGDRPSLNAIDCPLHGVDSDHVERAMAIAAAEELARRLAGRLRRRWIPAP